MAVEAKKPENATVLPEDPDKRVTVDELKSEISQLRKAYATLDSNFKRNQKKIARLEVENDDLREKTTPKDAKALTTSPNPTTNVPAAVIDATSTSQSDDAHDHEMEWVPPYCGEHGCENKLFQREVVCAGCGGPIGSESYAKHKLKACPLCGVNAGYKAVEGYQTKHDGCTGPECKVKT